MRKWFLNAALALLVFGLGASGAEAFVGSPGVVAGAETGSLATPAAMCGYSCRGGGRYIPGPPSVCAEEGLRFCGSSRGFGPPGFRGEFDGRDRYREGRGCRTVTIERDDGTITRVRRCD
jgi:hypothetical protein